MSIDWMVAWSYVTASWAWVKGAFTYVISRFKGSTENNPFVTGVEGQANVLQNNAISGHAQVTQVGTVHIHAKPDEEKRYFLKTKYVNAYVELQGNTINKVGNHQRPFIVDCLQVLLGDSFFHENHPDAHDLGLYLLNDAKLANSQKGHDKKSPNDIKDEMFGFLKLMRCAAPEGLQLREPQARPGYQNME